MSDFEQENSPWQQTADVVLLLCTVASIEEAKTLAEGMIKQQLAACVNLVPNVTSIYQWQGQVEESAECLLLIKAKRSNAESIGRFIVANHSYTTPELIELDIKAGLPDYLAWLGA